MDESVTRPYSYKVDYLTLIALSMLAYTLAVLLHEHLGHALTCVLLGGHPSELGAFYVDCQYGSMPDLSIRLVALAGPLVSLITGVVGFLALDHIPRQSTHLRYWVWLLGTIGLMSATGYLLFSGVSGLGDFGNSRDGVFYQVQPEWIWRLALSIAGFASYLFIIYLSLRQMDKLIGGVPATRVAQAQKLALTSYLTGAVTSILIGFLNPVGVVIVLTSAAAATLGGTSGLAWMMQWLNRKKAPDVPQLHLERSWAWIGAGFIVTILYAAIFGPSIHP